MGSAASQGEGGPGRWNYPSQATAAFEMVLSPGRVEQVPPGACLSCRPPPPDFSLLFAPYPSTLPGGKGEPKLFSCKAPAPCIPGLNPRFAVKATGSNSL